MTATLTVEQVLARLYTRALQKRGAADCDSVRQYWDDVADTVNHVYYSLLSYGAIPCPSDEEEIGLDAVKFPPSEEEWY